MAKELENHSSAKSRASVDKPLEEKTPPQSKESRFKCTDSTVILLRQSNEDSSTDPNLVKILFGSCLLAIIILIVGWCLGEIARPVLSFIEKSFPSVLSFIEKSFPPFLMLTILLFVVLFFGYSIWPGLRRGSKSEDLMVILTALLVLNGVMDFQLNSQMTEIAKAALHADDPRIMVDKYLGCPDNLTPLTMTKATEFDLTNTGRNGGQVYFMFYGGGWTNQTIRCDDQSFRIDKELVGGPIFSEDVKTVHCVLYLTPNRINKDLEVENLSFGIAYVHYPIRSFEEVKDQWKHCGYNVSKDKTLYTLNETDIAH